MRNEQDLVEESNHHVAEWNARRRRLRVSFAYERGQFREQAHVAHIDPVHRPLHDHFHGRFGVAVDQDPQSTVPRRASSSSPSSALGARERRSLSTSPTAVPTTWSETWFNVGRLVRLLHWKQCGTTIAQNGAEQDARNEPARSCRTHPRLRVSGHASQATSTSTGGQELLRSFQRELPSAVVVADSKSWGK